MTDLKQMLEDKPKGRLSAEDLRIGNIVYDPKIDLPIEISWAYLRDMPNLNLQGMTLTKERLKGLGFVSDIKEEWFYKDGIEIGYITTDGNFEYEYNRMEKPTQLKCVHDIQNLYRSLKETDLKIDLSKL